MKNPQKRLSEKEEDCPVVRALGILGGKHTFLIIRDLLGGPRRYGELHTSIGEISTKTLAERLVFLEEEGIITKKSFAEMPPRVEYRLTKKGEGLGDIITALREWGEEEN